MPFTNSFSLSIGLGIGIGFGVGLGVNSLKMDGWMDKVRSRTDNRICVSPEWTDNSTYPFEFDGFL